MEERRHGLWHTVREFVTHWSVAGAILAATGAAPEHWFAELLHDVPVPHEALPLWLEHIDYRLLAVIAGLSIVVGDNLWRHHGRRSPVAPETAVPPLGPKTLVEAPRLPDRPSIAVLAFTNLSDDSSQEYFSDGVADDILTELSRNRSLFVIARNSSFTYKGRAVDIKQVGRELGVRYIVEGSVRREGSLIRITAQLIDATSGSHIWAERFDRGLADIFIVQDEITRAVVTAIGPAISLAERQRAMRKSPESLSAWEAYQRALSCWSEQGNLSLPRAFLHQAISLDPGFAPAHAMMAQVYLIETSLGIGPPLRESVRLAEIEARTALDLDPGSSLGHAKLALLYTYQGDERTALEEAEAAITLNPNDPEGYLIKGRILVFTGQPAEAGESLATALRLDPRGPTTLAVMVHRFIGCYFERDYAAAEVEARRVIRAYPESPRAYPWLAAALGQLGQAEEARTVLEAATATSPSFFAFITVTRPPYYRPEDHEHLLDGLRKAGWKG